MWRVQGGADRRYEQRPSDGSCGARKVAFEGMQDSIDLLISL